MSCCGMCGDSVGPTSQARKEHAVREHGYPNCPTCNRVIKNLRLFEDHIRTPHRKTKCLIHTCDELVLVGKELEHGRTAHGFPNCSCGKTINLNWGVFSRHFNSHKMDVECPACDDVMPDWMLREHAITLHGFPTCAVCGKTIGSNFANFATHVESHSSSKAPKIKRRRRRRPPLELRNTCTNNHNHSRGGCGGGHSPFDAAVDAYESFYASLFATTTTIPAPAEGDGDHPRLLDAVYYEDDEDDESTPSIPLPPRQARRLK